MICGSVLYNVGCGRESGDVRIDNIKERLTLKGLKLVISKPLYLIEYILITLSIWHHLQLPITEI